MHNKSRVNHEELLRAADAAFRMGEEEQYIGIVRTLVDSGWDPTTHNLNSTKADLLKKEGLYVKPEVDSWANELSSSGLLWRTSPEPNYIKIVNNAFIPFEGHYNPIHFPDWFMKRHLVKIKDGGCHAKGYTKMSRPELAYNYPKWQDEISARVEGLCATGKCDSRLLGHSDWKEWRYQVKKEPYQSIEALGKV